VRLSAKAIGWKTGAILLAGLTAAVMWYWIAGPKIRNRTVFLAAIFSRDGREVYYIERDLRALVDERPFEIPLVGGTTFVKTRLWEDSVSLRRIAIDRTKLEVIRTFPPTPFAGRTYSSTGIFFETEIPMVATMGWAPDGQLEYTVSLDFRTNPTETPFFTMVQELDANRGLISDKTWRRYAQGEDTSIAEHLEDRFSEPYEVVAGGDSLLLLNERRRELRILAGAPVPYDQVVPQLSHRQALEEERRLRLAGEGNGMQRGYLRNGKSPDEASRMASAGIIRRPGPNKTLKARVLSAAEISRLDPSEIFVISSVDDRDSLDPWLQEAITNPGEALMRPIERLVIAENGRPVSRLNKRFMDDPRPGTIAYVAFHGKVFELLYD
jgi:hypothetical protein